MSGPRVLVLGAGGMAGHMLAHHLREAGRRDLHTAARTRVFPDTHLVDVTRTDRLRALLGQVRPEVVVNAVGMLVQASAADTAMAILVNSHLPHALVRFGDEIGFRLIHVSTDCVFSGRRGGYAEQDFRDADTPYARTKALGEIDRPGHFTIRTSIIGPELNRAGTGLLHWVLNQHGDVQGYSNVFWSGVTTLELARFIDSILDRPLDGLCHLTGADKISKYDLLLLIARIWERRDLVVHANGEVRSDKSMVCTRTDLGWEVPGYERMLLDLRAWMIRHAALYPHYEPGAGPPPPQSRP